MLGDRWDTAIDEASKTPPTNLPAARRLRPAPKRVVDVAKPTWKVPAWTRRLASEGGGGARLFIEHDEDGAGASHHAWVRSENGIPILCGKD